MKKNNLLFYFFAFFVLFQIKANFRNNIIEEASFKEASSIFIIQTDSIFKKKYNKIYNIYREKNFIVALKQALNLLDEVKVKSNPENLFMIISLVADIYDKTNKYSNSLDYYKSSLSILKQTNILENSNLFSNPDYAKILLRIGSAFQKLEKKDSATYYYSKLEAIQSLNTDVLGFKAVSFNNLSGLYELDSLYGKAKEYAIKAINIHRKRNDKAGEATALNNLANIYLSQGNFEKAKELYIQGIELIENNNSANAIRFKGNLYYNLAWAMRSLKDYKAYDFQELSYEIEDGIRNKEVRTMIEEVTAQYDVKGV
ncbi:MAG: tetratricopeptide repeat protein, partial [Polaribacter sp.]